MRLWFKTALSIHSGASNNGLLQNRKIQFCIDILNIFFIETINSKLHTYGKNTVSKSLQQTYDAVVLVQRHSIIKSFETKIN